MVWQLIRRGVRRLDNEDNEAIGAEDWRCNMAIEMQELSRVAHLSYLHGAKPPPIRASRRGAPVAPPAALDPWPELKGRIRDTIDNNLAQ